MIKLQEDSQRATTLTRSCVSILNSLKYGPQESGKNILLLGAAGGYGFAVDFGEDS